MDGYEVHPDNILRVRDCRRANMNASRLHMAITLWIPDKVQYIMRLVAF